MFKKRLLFRKKNQMIREEKKNQGTSIILGDNREFVYRYFI